ncbi:HD domain-containing phosphohydrolase [Nonomuraea endophytica]|uniref:HD domain-containing phosphohydrolase n=1 Tax=Nonomuraea endophytica TaxID=714136 RepID=UPI0037C6E37B
MSASPHAFADPPPGSGAAAGGEHAAAVGRDNFGIIMTGGAVHVAPAPPSPRPVTLIRMHEADPRLLGVHAAIDAPGATGDLPVYIPRDTDTTSRGIRALMARAADRGGMVVVVGRSSVGKSRCAYEAVRAVLPQRLLLHPADAEQVRQVAERAPADLVVWLDELQRYLGGSAGLSAATVRTLLHMRTVVIATLWSERYTAFVTLPPHDHPDVYAAEREFLKLADVVHLSETFSAAEQQRAQDAAAAGDRRIVLALRSTDYGLTQTIAAAPQLVDRWRGADPYAAAVLNAAIDASGLGAVSALSAELLRAAAPGYCDARQRAIAPANWFQSAIAYATAPLNGAAAALVPIAGPTTMGQITGYLVADYLQQHAGHQRRLAKVPTTCWQALIDHLTDPDDQARVATAAQNRLLPEYAERLYRPAIDNDGGLAAGRLAGLLVGQGRVEEALMIWQDRASAGDEPAGEILAALLDEQHQVEEALAIWRSRVDAGDRTASMRLAGLLVGHGRVKEAHVTWHGSTDIGDWTVADGLSNPPLQTVTADELAAVLMAAMEIKDPYTRSHSERMASLVAMIGRQIGMRHADIEAARLAGLLHDIGKLAVPRTILRKEGPLTDEDFTLIQSHVTYGISIVGHMLELFGEVLEPKARGLIVDGAFEGILHHHERYDGRGYPLGLQGCEIPQIARAVAVADVFDALTSQRSYRPARPIAEVIAELRRSAGAGLDPVMVEAFLAVLDSHFDELARSRPAGN